MHIDPQQFIRLHLNKSLTLIQQKNAAFSQRALAKKLTISSASLSEILKGRRKVSHSKALHFARILNWDDQIQGQLNRYFDTDAQFTRLKDFTNNSRSREELTNPSSHHLFQHWIYITLLAALRMTNPPSSPQAMAERLGLPLEEVRWALDRLLKQGFLEIDDEGNLQDLKKTWLTAPDLTPDFFKPRIEQSLAGMQAALNQSAKPELVQWEGFVSTVTTNQTRIKEATPIIEDFVRRLSLFLSDTSEKDQVFELNINLFPRSRMKTPAQMSSA